MLNMDFSQRAVIHTAQEKWQPSPAKGIERKLLEREEAERGRATSIVRYAPDSKFATHQHPLGEEIVVLEGIFSDESGDYPAGTYLRNPPGSQHAPFSKQGCTLFVKLHQFSRADKEVVRLDTTSGRWLQGHGGLQVMPLHSFETEHTALVKWPAGEVFKPHRHYAGEEILVLSGEFIDEFGRYPKGTWLRSPHASKHTPYVEEETIIYVKTGHLPVLDPR